MTMMIGGEGELLVNTATNFVSDAMTMTTNTITNTEDISSSLVLSFADQGQNLAGIFFQSSLLPYLAYLYFIGFRENKIPALSNFGLQFILFFVVSTIPSGIISKSTYGVTLANCDWLHGSAEFLLTVANVMLVLGFKEQATSMATASVGGGSATAAIGGNDDDSATNSNSLTISRVLAFGSFAIFVATCVLGPSMFEPHTPFMAGVGDLPAATSAALPWASQHPDPENALSIPTWIIHYSSVIEFIIAMRLVWEYAKRTGNETWKGLTWGMLPLHASGVCACTYHLFYNNMQFIVTMQAGLTALGNLTCAIAAYRIAVSNGWTFGDLNPFNKDNESEDNDSTKRMTAVKTSSSAAVVVEQDSSSENSLVLFGKITATTIVLSYLTKYGELGVDFPFSVNPPLALGIIVAVPLLTAFPYLQESNFLSFGKDEDGEEKKGLSMADVKKFGAAGILAYVLTELAFWAVAFPVASTALYQTSGHWPDVINDATDRTTVLGFIFAGANVARLLVPVRLGAALALAPWVDENITNRENNE